MGRFPRSRRRRPPRRHSRSWSGLGAGLVALFAASSASAQTVAGVVREESTSVVIVGADVTLTSQVGGVVARTVSDSTGRFTLRIPAAGLYRLGASRIGYEPFASDPFLVTPDQRATADVFLRIRPVELDPLEVVTEGQVQRLAQVGFYRRLEMGFGTFLTREDIQASHADRLADVFRGLPGFSVVSSGGSRFDLIMRAGRSQFFRIDDLGAQTCYPSISIDGMVVRRGGPQENSSTGANSGSRDVGTWGEPLHPDDLEAVEIYRGQGGLPVQVAGSVSPCGAVLIWTRDE